MSLSAFASITTIVLDVDGVLTDGNLWLMPNGEMVRCMNVKDGYALQLAVKKGYRVVVISGGISQLVEERLQKLGITDVFMGVHDKPNILRNYMTANRLQPTELLFMGDDLPDLDAMRMVGLACCPADACPQIQAVSQYISAKKGGEGCVRDVLEKVMTLRGHWQHQADVSSK
jgi:3-deoxy-D-manno-octulosonate 8-phosphate phosphatase (KDO 8-P phosphatase)